MSKNKKKSNDKTPRDLGRAAAHIRLLAMGVLITGGCGMLLMTDNAYNLEEHVIRTSAMVKASAETRHDVVRAEDSVTTDEEVTAAEVIEVMAPEAEKPEFVKFNKAAVGEYDLSTPETKSKAVKVENKGITDPNDFTVPFPEQDTLIYEPQKNPPQNLTATRSVAGEYYRVHDENSGSTMSLNAHELLCLMVNNEIGDSWDEDAIKAQIIAAYSHLRYHKEHGLTPTIGLKYGYSSKLEGCVNAVEGQAMIYDGEVINAVYSASSAGYTTTALDIWNMDLPYLKCVESIYDSQDPNWGVERKFSRDQVRNMLQSRFGISLSDDVTKWFTVERAYSVRYIDSVIIDGRDSCKLTGIQLCNMFDLKSNAIEIRYKDGEFTFISYGWGHGVGMSQWGAHYYAENGWTYDQILTHYYVGAKLELSQPAAGASEEENSDSSSSKAETAAQTQETALAPQDTNTSYDNSDQWTQTTAPEQQWTPETQWQTETQWTDPNAYGTQDQSYASWDGQTSWS